MIVKIDSYEGKSWGSHIDYGVTYVEIEGVFPQIALGQCVDGLKLMHMFKAMEIAVVYTYHPNDSVSVVFEK